MPFSGLVPYADPLRAGRHPFERFLLIFCTVAGLPLLFGNTNSGSVEHALPQAIGMAWGAILCGGAGIALLGTYWPIQGERDNPANYATSLTLERIGLALVGPGALVYAVILVVVAGMDGFLAASLTAGFAWAAISRMRHVARVIKRAILLIEEAERRR